MYYTFKSNKIYPVIKAGNKNILKKWIILPRSPLPGENEKKVILFFFGDIDCHLKIWDKEKKLDILKILLLEV